MIDPLAPSSLKESRQHGTVSFPCAFYFADHTALPQEPPVFQVNHHWHDEIEIIHFEKGVFELDLDMNHYTIDRECFCCINPGQLHSIRSEQVFQEQSILFSPEMLSFENADIAQVHLIRPLMDHRMLFPGFIWKEDPAFPLLSQAFDSLRNVFFGSGVFETDMYILKTAFAQLRVKAALMEMISGIDEYHLFTENTMESNLRLESMKSVLAYIKENYANKIYLSDLAAILGMNEQYFCRFFKKSIGKTPVEYINEYRIRHAVKLLQDSSIPVMDVCLESGFNNLGHFMKEFKKATGNTPLQLRKQYDSLRRLRSDK